MKYTFTFALILLINQLWGQTYEDLKNQHLPKPKNPDFVASVNFTESNLPIVVINTNGQTIPDEPKINAQMGIINNGAGNINRLTDAFNAYNGNIGIEVRGNSSQFYPKKSYGFETQDANHSSKNFSILGMPSNDDWTLIATAFDKTMLRNSVMYKLWERMGYYSVRTRFCEVVLNGTYIGVYTLTEKLKRGTNRVNIAKLNNADTDQVKITGGYIINTDWPKAGDVNYWQSTVSNQHTLKTFIVDTPKASDLHIDQFNYIRQYFTDFEATLNSPNFNDPINGYRKYIDENTFIDYFLIQEFCKNLDAYMASMYYHKDRGGKLKIAPVWDFDAALAYDGAVVACSETNLTSGWMFRGTHCLASLSHFWWERFLQDCNYTSKVRLRYANLRQNVLSNAAVMTLVDSLSNHLQAPMTREYQKWGMVFHGNTTISHQSEISNLKSWISQRLAWLDAHIQDLDTFTPIISSSITNPTHSVPTTLSSTTIPTGYTLEWKWSTPNHAGTQNTGIQNTLSVIPRSNINYEARLIKNDGTCSTFYSNKLIFNTNPNCQNQILIIQNITNSTSPVANFKANDKIQASNSIAPNTRTSYKSGGSVELLPGFTISSGGVFEAKIETCTN
jgi:hypothetical protein